MSDSLINFIINQLGDKIETKKMIHFHSFGQLMINMGILDDYEIMSLVFECFKENNIEIVGLSKKNGALQSDSNDSEYMKLYRKLNSAYSAWETFNRLTKPDPIHFKNILNRVDEILKERKFSHIDREPCEDE